MGTIAVISGKATLHAVKSLGHRLVLIDSMISVSGMLQADIAIESDLDDWEGVKEELEAVHHRHPVDAVLTNNQNYVPLAAYLSESLGIVGISIEAARNCTDKWQMRQVLNTSGISTVACEKIRRAEDVEAAAQRIGFPFVVKPVRGSASRGVRYCGEERGLREIIKDLRVQADSGGPDEWMVEAYLDGMQLTVDAVIREGRPEVIAVLECEVGGFPHFVTTGFRYPPRIDREEREAVEKTVTEALKALGVRSGNAHVEVRLTEGGPKIVEVNPRAPGGRIREMVMAVTGVDLLTEGIASVTGDAVPRGEPKARCVLYRSLFVEERGRLQYETSFLEEGTFPVWNGLSSIVEVDVPPGEPVSPVGEEVGVLGRVVVFGRDTEQVERDLKVILDRLALRVERGSDFDWR